MIRRPVLLGPLVISAALALAACSSTPPASVPPSAPSPAQASADQVKTEPLTPQRLQSLWWSWTSSAEPGQSPVEDATGQYCGDSQPFGVWLVAGTSTGTADRHCQIPATLPIAGPAVAKVTKDQNGCATFLAAAKGEALLDGKPVQLEKTEPTKITYDSEQGSQEGFSCGLWVRVAPLSPGEHRLTLKGSSGGFASEVNYELSVVNL